MERDFTSAERAKKFHNQAPSSAMFLKIKAQNFEKNFLLFSFIPVLHQITARKIFPPPNNYITRETTFRFKPKFLVLSSQLIRGSRVEYSLNLTFRQLTLMFKQQLMWYINQKMGKHWDIIEFEDKKILLLSMKFEYTNQHFEFACFTNLMWFSSNFFTIARNSQTHSIYSFFIINVYNIVRNFQQVIKFEARDDLNRAYV